MCKMCESKPVYEFTNGRKICSSCFVRWFQKKALYTIRKFSMIRKEEVIGYGIKNSDFRDVVLEDILKVYSKGAIVGLVKAPSKKKFDKLALSITTDLIANTILDKLIHSVVNAEKFQPIDGKVIKPLCLFTDKEVLLYAKLKNLKFKLSREKKGTKNNISNFIDELEKKHPEIKHAIVSGFLELKK